MHILSLEGVTKRYRDTLAVNDVSFAMPEGSIFGLLGPNGAGKTSIIRIITTITRADEGRVMLDGKLLNAGHPALIGYMPEERGLYKKMKVGEHLLYLARLKGLSAGDAKKAIGGWLEKFEIGDWWNKKVEELSKGMQQKIQFIATVVHQPRLLILDEPFSGLDPINANLIKDEIYQLRQAGTSIIFSTHRMEQVEEICENIVLINKGQNVLSGAVQAVREQYKEHLFRIRYVGELPAGVAERADIHQQMPGELVIKVAEDQASNELLRYLIGEGVFIQSFNEILPGLNEIFIKKVQSMATA